MRNERFILARKKRDREKLLEELTITIPIFIVFFMCYAIAISNL